MFPVYVAVWYQRGLRPPWTLPQKDSGPLTLEQHGLLLKSQYQ